MPLAACRPRARCAWRSRTRHRFALGYDSTGQFRRQNPGGGNHAESIWQSFAGGRSGGGLRGSRRGAAGHVHDRAAGRLMDPPRRRPEGHVGEGGSRPADHNVRGVDEGKAQIGIANSSTTVDGIAGRAPYPKKVTHVCQVANLYPQYFQVVALADSGIKSLADLKGKVLVTQPKGNTAEVLTAEVLKLNGMTYQSLAYTDAVGMMKDGHAQVFTLGTTAPASAVMDLASARDVQLVPVDDKTMAGLKKTNGGYNKLIIKAGTYPKQDKDVPVIGYSTHIVARCDLPDDTVYKMTKTMAQNIDDMAAIVKAIHGVTAKDMALDIGVPFHKGATKFYKEVGAM
jgi:TRAP transporter TAXI family solute receptor